MDKESWIKKKIAILIDEGKDPDEAVAIAHAMWDDIQKKHSMAAEELPPQPPPPPQPQPPVEPPPPPEPEPPVEKPPESVSLSFARKPIVMPILPAAPQRTVDGREITQELIDAVLAYDAEKRTAIVGLDNDAAHGGANLPILGKVQKTYKKDGMIVADVFPVKDFEQILPILASEQYPDRSIEVDTLHLDGTDIKQLYLEKIKLCGNERPALNLPPVTFTKRASTNKEIFKYSLSGGPMVEENVEPNTETSRQMMTVVPIEKELAKLKADYAKRDSEKEERIAQLEAKLLDEELLNWVKSPKMLRKIPPFLRNNAVNILRAAAERRETATYHFAKDIQEIPLGEAIKALFESLPDTLVAISAIGDGLPNHFENVAITKHEREMMALAKVKKYAKDNNLNLADPLHFTKAEEAVKRENPDLWEAE